MDTKNIQVLEIFDISILHGNLIQTMLKKNEKEIPFHIKGEIEIIIKNQT